MASGQISQLHRLAHLYGVQTAYRDVTGRWRSAETAALLAVLRALGAPVEGLDDVDPALREHRQNWWRRLSEPVTVAWEGEEARVKLRLPANRAGGHAACRLELESGEERGWRLDLAELPVVRREEVEGLAYVALHLCLPRDLPAGYHRLFLDLPGGDATSLIIAAPRRAWGGPISGTGRVWGVFLPLYALHSRRGWGSGDFTDWGELGRWARALGGRLVGSVPLLAAFLDRPFDPSPYAPVSRLFWNEFYLDPTQAPEVARCPAVRELLASREFQEEVAALRAGRLVDYRRGMVLRRRVLELLAAACFQGGGERREVLERWAARHQRAWDYARFRAVGERQGRSWPDWPPRLRRGKFEEGDYDPAVAGYHLYVQWLAAEQLAALARETELYLDFPVGVHPAGYDVWRERTAFAQGVECGAPPDPLFTGGQNWGFPPPHPEGLRAQGYQYYIACLRHHMRYAAALRLDHVMALHRLFWIPRGFPAEAGVYVRYPAEEFYAILALESRRHETLVVGEDLGTVPRYVRRAMGRHGLRRMYVGQLEFDPRYGRLPAVPARCLASLNTHDMPPFAAFWAARDPEERIVLADFLRREGWLAPGEEDLGEILRACLRYLAASRAEVLMLNLEDLWLETAPQNRPGTGPEEPNWRHKARYALEDLPEVPGVPEILREVDRWRKREVH